MSVLRSGERLGDFEIVNPLRAGGMATLYRARRRGAAGFARDVAIKVVHPHLAANPAFLRMFVEEAHLAVRIHHPNVVQVEELGAEGGNLYLVMELIRGCSLADLMEALAARGEHLAPLQAVRLGIQIAEGLHAAHETRDDRGTSLGVVHRDVSPHNVLVSERGYAKLIDFGIAKALGRDRTRTGTIKGTYAYMAPEQARGQEVDRRTDVYALGVVLWELLTLRRLFDAPTDMALLERVRSPAVEPPSRHAPDISPALDAALLAALAPRPEDRPPTADAFRQLLCEALPEASTASSAELEALVASVVVPASSTALDGDAQAAVAGRGFRRAAEGATTLPAATARAPLVTPEAGAVLRPTPAPLAPARRLRRTLVLSGLALLVTLAGALFAWREEPREKLALPEQTQSETAPAAVVSMPPAPEPEVHEEPTVPVPARPPEAEGPKGRAARPKARASSTLRKPATRVIDGVLVLDEAPY